MSCAPALLVFLTLLLPGCAAPPPGSAACVPRPLATLPVQFRAGVPTAQLRIDGQPVWMVLDLGAAVSVLSEATADRLHLARDPTLLPTLTGVGGSMTRWAVIAHRLELGSLVLQDKRIEVAPMALPARRDTIDGAFGLDQLTHYDIDWDLPHHQVTLNAASGCDGPPPGWPSPAVAVRLRHPATVDDYAPGPRLLQLPVAVDGRAMTALLDSGAATSLISPQAAATVEAPAPVREGEKRVQMAGIGPAVETGTLHRFRSLAFADVTVANFPAVIAAVPLWAGEMILGVGALRGGRVWLPAGAARIWFGPPETSPPATASPATASPATAPPATAP